MIKKSHNKVTIMFCKFCNEYLGILSLAYFCDFCSQLRRAVLLLKKDAINQLFEDHEGLTLLEPKPKPKEELNEEFNEEPKEELNEEPKDEDKGLEIKCKKTSNELKKSKKFNDLTMSVMN